MLQPKEYRLGLDLTKTFRLSPIRTECLESRV